MAQHVFFIRHGQSDSNVGPILRADEAELTEAGKQEAEAVSKRVERLNVDAIISSTYPRAIATATPASRVTGHAIETSPLLVEMRMPSFIKGKQKDNPEIENIRKNIWEQFGLTDYRHSDEEVFTEFRQRAADALAFLAAHPAERVAVVTHGVFLRGLLASIVFGAEFTGEDFKHAWRFATDNTGITYLKRFPDENWQKGWEIMSWNDSAHLG